jgi:hypothetical protein
MGMVARYRRHLVRRATGVSRLGWYVVSAVEGTPWVLVIVALTLIASSTPEPNRFLAMGIAFIPGFVGFVASQFYMLVVHLKDLRSRAEIHN